MADKFTPLPKKYQKALDLIMEALDSPFSKKRGKPGDAKRQRKIATRRIGNKVKRKTLGTTKWGVDEYGNLVGLGGMAAVAGGGGAMIKKAMDDTEASRQKLLATQKKKPSPKKKIAVKPPGAYMKNRKPAITYRKKTGARQGFAPGYDQPPKKKKR